MKFELLKDWAGHKKSAHIEIKDKTVIYAGLKIGLFKSIDCCGDCADGKDCKEKVVEKKNKNTNK